MKKSLFLLLIIPIFITSCGQSKKEKMEKDTAKILVTYNKAIAAQKKAVNEVYQSAQLVGYTNQELLYLKGVNWQQKSWDTMRVHYKIDSLENSYSKLFGKDNYNILKLKIDKNWNEKTK